MTIHRPLFTICCALVTTACAVDEPAAPPTSTFAIKCPISDPDCEPPPVDDSCAELGTQPTGTRTYSCDFTLTDSYHQPAANLSVTMETYWCDRRLTSTSSVTQANGLRRITASGPAASQIVCIARSDEGFDPPSSQSSSFVDSVADSSSTGALSTGEVMGFTRQVQPVPSATVSLAGLLTSSTGRMDLYASGAYDKVVIFVEPFDTLENTPGATDRRRLWMAMQQLLVPLNQGGWDVWLFQPGSTGDSLHEQAAQLARGIQAAATRSLGFDCQAGRTIDVFGFNSGGVVARLATARWEADALWRAQVGLPATLPVKLLGTGDAPNYGMHVNIDLQKQIWQHADPHAKNIDSCAASQLLRGRYNPATDSTTNQEFRNFWVNGSATTRNDATTHAGSLCTAGPPLATLNAARGVPGWPATPFRVGFASSNSFDRRKCIADPGGNLNALDQDLCRYRFELSSSPDYQPTTGTSWARVYVDGWFDRYLNTEDRIEWSDLEPGSRNPAFVDVAGPHYSFHQRFPTTLVPNKSAHGTQGPIGSNLYAAIASPFDEFQDAPTTEVADRVSFAEGAQVIGWLNQHAPSCNAIVLQ